MLSTLNRASLTAPHARNANEARSPGVPRRANCAVPQAWVDQLALGGRLVAPVVTAGAPGSQALLVLDKTAQGVRQTILEAVHFVPLKSGVA